MDFFERAKEAKTRDEAIVVYEASVRDYSSLTQFAALNPDRFSHAIRILQTTAGRGYVTKWKELEATIKDLAEPIRDQYLQRRPKQKVVDVLTRKPPERLVARSVLNRMKVPQGFSLTDRGITKTLTRGDREMEVPVLPDPILLTGTASPIGSSLRNVYLAFRDVSMRWRQVTITLEDIGSHNKLLALARYGIAINNDNKQYVMEFLSSFWKENRYDLPAFDITMRMGWTGEDAKKFVWPDEVVSVEDDGLDILFQPREGMEGSLKAFKQKGDLAGAFRIMEVVRKYPIPMFALGHGLAGFMLRLMKEEYEVKPTMLDIGAKTGTGKSVIAKLVCWLYGKPGFEPADVGTTWKKSPRAFEEQAGVYGSVPMVLDDTKHIFTKYRGKKNGLPMLVQCIYACHDGGGYQRLNRDGSFFQTASWWTNFVSTGEETMNRMIREDEGARARIVPIEQPPFGKFDKNGTGRDIKWLDREIQRNYGVLGREWVKLLLKMWKDAEWSCPGAIGMLYETYLEELEALAVSSEATRVAKSIAASLTALDIAHEYMGLPKPVDDLTPLARKIMEATNYHSNKGDRTLRNLVVYLQHNPRNVIGVGATEQSRIWAAWPQKGKPYLLVSEATLREFFSREGVSYRQTMEDWLQSGYFLFSTNAKFHSDNFDAWLKTARTTERRKIMAGCSRTIHGYKLNAEYVRDLIANDALLDAEVPTEDDVKSTPAPQELQGRKKVSF